MKLKYYLRGLGIGIIITTIILVSCFAMQKPKMTDEDIIAKAEQLGMIMPEQDKAEVVETETASTEENGQETETEETPEETEQQTAGEETPDGTEQQTAAEETSEKTEQQTAAEETSEKTEQQTETTEKQEVSSQEQENTPQEPFTLVVKRGDVCRTMCENLAANGVIDDAEGLRKYLSEIGYASFISAGTYQIPYHASYEEITSILKAGPLEQQKQQ